MVARSFRGSSAKKVKNVPQGGPEWLKILSRVVQYPKQALVAPDFFFWNTVRTLWLLISIPRIGRSLIPQNSTRLHVGGNGYFSIGENGNLYVHPDRSPKRHVDLKQLIDRLQVRVLTSQSFCGLVKFCSIGFKKSIKPFPLQWKRVATGVTTAVSIN